MRGLIDLIPAGAARRLLGGPYVESSGTVRQGPVPPGQTAAAWRAVAMTAPGGRPDRWRRTGDGVLLGDADVVDWPRVELPFGSGLGPLDEHGGPRREP